MKSPTEAQLNDPKWWDENAPRLATHIDLKRMVFCNSQGTWEGSAQFWNEDPLQDDWFTDRYFPRPTKPAEPEWDGEGYPPVGCECEYRIGGGETEWYPCKVKYVLAGDTDPDADGWRAVVWCPHLEKDQLAHLPRFQFRPLRTAEQRQRKQLVAAIARAPVDPHGYAVMVHPEMLADALIADGWRKGDE